MIKQIGIDLDTHRRDVLKFYKSRMEKFGQIIDEYRTKKGWHFRVQIKGKLGFRTTMEMRLWCGDDPRRIMYDIIKHWHGFAMTDLLFKKKWIGWK